MRPGFAGLSREQLAVLLPELLLCGHLVDRSGMAHLLDAFGRDGMRDVAIEEWMAASPVYTRRMRQALGVTGHDVESIFKCLQFDIGAPPQFMDFRYAVHGPDSGEFTLAHCGALMDVEPMGEEYVRAMCHDIEDPTFDATAVATNPRARMRPVHRPPRVPADRHPHCRWTVTIDPATDPVPMPALAAELARSRAGTLTRVTEVDRAEDGLGDYARPLRDDVDFGALSRSLLQRVAEEICLQGQLLALGFLGAVRRRTTAEQAMALGRKQLTGVAGVAAERIRLALRLGTGLHDAEQVLSLHPALNPPGYVDVRLRRTGDVLTLRLGRGSPAHADGGWPAWIDPDALRPVEAILQAVSPTLVVDAVEDDEEALTLRIVDGGPPADQLPEVQVARFSTGTRFRFEPRRSLPITPVQRG